MKTIKRLWTCVLELVYPRRAICVGCGDMSGCEREWLCEKCRLRLVKSWIGAFQPPVDSNIDGAACAYHYAGPAGGMVRWLKYRGAHRLAEIMASDMAKAFSAIEPTGVDLVVPVPMHKKRRSQRGMNQSEILAKAVAAKMNLPCENALVRLRNTPQQARLSGEERRRNLKGAIWAEKSLAGRRILLVDDVCTTGATAIACEKALREAGAENVFLLCYAAAKE